MPPAARAEDGGGAAPARAWPDRSVSDALTAILGRAVLSGNESERATAVAALRRLRDPALLPLFAHVLMGGGVSPQLHAMLGIAELDPTRGLDLLAVRQLPDASWRSIMVLEAAKAGLLDDNQLIEVGAWRDLEPGPRVQIAGRALRQGRGIDAEAIRPLLDDPSAEMALCAAVVVAQSAGDAAADRVMRTRWRSLVGTPEALRRVAVFVGANRLGAGAAMLGQIHADLLGKDTVLADDVLVAQLLAAPELTATTEKILVRLEKSTPVAERRSLAARLLDASLVLGDSMPQAIGEALAGDTEPTLAAAGSAVHALSIGCGSSGGALVRLAQRPDGPTLAWCLKAAEVRHWQDARSIRQAVLGTALGQTGVARAALEPVAADAAFDLAKSEPGVLTDELALAVTAGDALACRVLLDGLLRCGRAESTAVVTAFGLDAKPAGRWPDATCAALALMVAARSDPQGAGVLAERLKDLALGTGGAGLSTPIRVQAAWLALRASGEDRVALARVLGTASEAQGAPGNDR